MSKVRFRDQQRRWSHRYFVGRRKELSLLRSRGASPRVVYLHGPAGIGKSALLRELAGPEVDYLDGAILAGTPGALIEALAAARRRRASTIERLFRDDDRGLIVIDECERLAPLDSWLRLVLLPALPRGIGLVIATRVPPSPAWRKLPGWGTLVRELPLRSLGVGDGRELLRRRGVPPAQHAAILRFAGGHPLALVLAGDYCMASPHTPFQPADAPGVVQALITQFGESLSNVSRRAALEASALVRYTTEPLLADLLAVSEARAQFDWLGTLSFMEMGPRGRAPHALVRNLIAEDLRWRNPGWHSTLLRRAHEHNLRRIERSPRSAVEIVGDELFLYRQEPAMAAAFAQAAGSDQLWIEQARREDVPGLVALVARHEGPRSAELAAHWLTRQLDGVIVMRDGGREPAGFVAQVWLERASAEELEFDPATRAAARFLATHAPLGRGERALLNRFWMARGAYQSPSPVASLIPPYLTEQLLATRNLVYSFTLFADADFWHEQQTYVLAERLPQVDFTIDGRRFGVFGHDWRKTPPTLWLAKLAARLTAAAAPGLPSRKDFDGQLRHCLRDLVSPLRLRKSPLTRLGCVVQGSGEAADESSRAAALFSLINQLVDEMRRAPKTARWARALEITYLSPAPTQSAAAERLGASFSTYRRDLANGVADSGERLWAREQAVAQRPSA